MAEGASRVPVKTLLLTAVQKYQAHHGASLLRFPWPHCPNAATLPRNSAPGTHLLVFQASGAKTTTGRAPPWPPVPALGFQRGGLRVTTLS